MQEHTLNTIVNLIKLLDMKEDAVPETLYETAPHPFEIGESVLIRTVTFTYTGKVEKVVAGFVFLSQAAWIPETARFANTISDGELNEVEPIKGVERVNIATIVDICVWEHPLPQEQK